MEILVITNGKAVIVPADKWPEEPSYCPPVLEDHSFHCGENPEHCLCVRERNDYEKDKLEAITQGAVVEGVLPFELRKTLGYETDLNDSPKVKDGAYPIDPAKWLVDKQYEFFNSLNVWQGISEAQYNSRKNNPSYTKPTRQIATIKPKAEDNRSCDQSGDDSMGCMCPTEEERNNCRHYNEPSDTAPAPTRKLAMDELIEGLQKVIEGIDAIGAIYIKTPKDAYLMAIKDAKKLRAKEIDNILNAWSDREDFSLKRAKEFFSQTYQL